MTDIEKREKNLLDMMENFSTWKDVTKINTNDENIYACRYNDTIVTLDKMNAFIYRLHVYDASPKYSIIDIEAEYHFNIKSGTMKMFFDSFQEHIKDNSPAALLTDLFSYMDKNLWWWINKPIPALKPKPIFMFGYGTCFMQHEKALSPAVEMLEKLQKKRKQVKKKLFSDEEIEADENEDKDN